MTALAGLHMADVETTTARAAEVRMLLCLTWHIDNGAPFPVRISHLMARGLAVSVELDCQRGVSQWARRFGVGITVEREHCAGRVCVASEVTEIAGRRIEFWSSVPAQDYAEQHPLFSLPRSQRR